MKKIFVAGGVSWDSIIQVGELPQAKSQTIFSSSYHEVVGSTGAGKAINIGRIGFDTTFHAMIGEDCAGEKIKKYFENEKCSFVYDEDFKGTAMHTNIMDDHGGRISIYTAYNTFEPELDYESFNELIIESDYLVFNIINYVRYLIPIAKKLNKKIWCDIHDYDGENQYHNDFINGADYILMSSDNMIDYKSFMEKLIKDGKELVVCTHGKDGASAMSKDGQYIEIGIIDKYKRVDTNGAGDSFFTGLLYGYSKSYDLLKSLRFGAIVAGLCVESKELSNEKLSVNFIEGEYKKIFKE